MEKKGKGVAPSGSSEPSSDGGGGSWAKVVAGRGPVVAWSSAPISTREVAELESFFSEALVLPAEEIGEEKEKWEGRALILRSLGRIVPPAWAGRDMRLRLGLGADPEVFPIAEDHFLVRFADKEVCDRAIQEAPWVVGGQLLAMEPWKPAFVPARRPISKAVVWLRLPGLPVECWRPSLILAIAAEAGKPLNLDSVTEQHRRKGYARVKVEIDSSKPVKPGVVVEAGGARFWQQFQFENLPPVCFRCGMVGHVESGCEGSDPAVAGVAGGLGVAAASLKPRLGPWISTTRIRQPRGAPTGVSRRAGPGPGLCPSSGPSSSSPPSVPRSPSSPPGSPSDTEGWQKPAKVARRVRVEEVKGGKGGGDLIVGGGSATPRAQAFAPLAELGDKMEVGEGALLPVECRMVDLEHTLLKRPRSPSVRSHASPTKPVSSDSVDLPLLLGSSQGSSPGAVSDSAPHFEGQVSPYQKPCMDGAAFVDEERGGRREEERRETDAGLALIPVEVRLVQGARGGNPAAGMGPGKLGTGVGAVGTPGGPAGGDGRGSAGGEMVGGEAGEHEAGKESLIVVGVREVEVMGEMEFGGCSSVLLARGAAGCGGKAGVGGRRRTGRGPGSSRGGRGGRWVRSRAGESSAAGVGEPSRDRSRSPGGRMKQEGGLVGGVDGLGKMRAMGDEHAGVVAAVRGAVKEKEEGSGEGSVSTGADSAGVSASRG